jgi:hypothetical protein
MTEIFLPDFVTSVASRLKGTEIQVASQWVTGSIDAQDAHVPLSSRVADLVIQGKGPEIVVVEFKEGPLSSVDVASLARHSDIIREQNPTASYALVTFKPPLESARSMLDANGVAFVVGSKSDKVADQLAAMVEDAPPARLCVQDRQFDVSWHMEYSGRCKMRVTWRTAESLKSSTGVTAELVDEQGLHLHSLVILQSRAFHSLVFAADIAGGGEVVGEVVD